MKSTDEKVNDLYNLFMSLSEADIDVRRGLGMVGEINHDVVLIRNNQHIGYYDVKWARFFFSTTFRDVFSDEVRSSVEAEITRIAGRVSKPKEHIRALSKKASKVDMAYSTVFGVVDE